MGKQIFAIILLLCAYNIACGVAISLSTKRRGCVHPLRPPSSNHCEEVLSFLDKAANLRLYLLWQRAGNITVHDQWILYSFWLRFHSTPRDSAGPSFTILFLLLPLCGHIPLSIKVSMFVSIFYFHCWNPLFPFPYRIFSRPDILVYAVRVSRWLISQFVHGYTIVNATLAEFSSNVMLDNATYSKAFSICLKRCG